MDPVRNLVVMNQNGEYFSGFHRGYFKWSLNYSDAKYVESKEQVDTIIKHSPLMEIVYDYL